jgi:hypothetical protein
MDKKEILFDILGISLAVLLVCLVI